MALTLLAGTGAVLFAWVNQSLRTLAELQERDSRSRLLLNAHSLIASIDPLSQAAGQLEAAGVRLDWTTETVHPLKNALLPEVDPATQWRVGLYRLTVRARWSHAPEAEPVVFSLLQPAARPPATVGSGAAPP